MGAAIKKLMDNPFSFNLSVGRNLYVATLVNLPLRTTGLSRVTQEDATRHACGVDPFLVVGWIARDDIRYVACQIRLIKM
jgi:hypothetical protein